MIYLIFNCLILDILNFNIPNYLDSHCPSIINFNIIPLLNHYLIQAMVSSHIIVRSIRFIIRIIVQLIIRIVVQLIIHIIILCIPLLFILLFTLQHILTLIIGINFHKLPLVIQFIIIQLVQVINTLPDFNEFPLVVHVHDFIPLIHFSIMGVINFISVLQILVVHPILLRLIGFSEIVLIVQALVI